MEEQAQQVHCIVFNVDKMRPACAILQTALGGDQGIAHLFPADTWSVDPNGLKLYKVSEGQLDQLVKAVTALHKKD